MHSLLMTGFLVRFLTWIKLAWLKLYMAEPVYFKLLLPDVMSVTTFLEPIARFSSYCIKDIGTAYSEGHISTPRGRGAP